VSKLQVEAAAREKTRKVKKAQLAASKAKLAEKRKKEAQKHKEEAQKRKKESASKKKTTKRTKHTYRYKLHQCVMCKYDKEWYKAQIFLLRAGKYSCYFLLDSEVRRNVPECDIKLPRKKENWAKLERNDCSEFEFVHDEEAKGCPKPRKSNGKAYDRFKVVKLGEKRNINKYLCVHANGKSNLYFDIAYVMKKYEKEVFGV